MPFNFIEIMPRLDEHFEARNEKRLTVGAVSL
jgi:hypothetical protein